MFFTMKEIVIKLVVYCVLVIVTAFVALEMADCQDLGRIFYDKGDSTAGQNARFYFLTLTGIGVIIVQNIFIRWALCALQRDVGRTESEPGAQDTK